jgi:hypothetical protein
LIGYQNTGLWTRSFGQISDANKEQLEQLTAAYSLFRRRAAELTSQIFKSLPALTLHDVTHLDALWETADLIAGSDYPLNPAEAFVFGGAVLLHDSALCFEAYRGGQEGLRESVEWRDAFAALSVKHPSAPEADKAKHADFFALRALHASRAADLANEYWTDPEGERFYLIENVELRKHFGQLIGKIASSHHWPIEDLTSRLQSQLNAPAFLPANWRVDPIKVACLLRCADAVHLDSRRAPDFLRALISIHGVSQDHWKAQNWLQRPDYDKSDPDAASIIFTSGKSFTEDDADAWWVAYDAIQVVHRELDASARLLESRIQRKESPPFQVRRVTGADSPEIVSKTIQTSGWTPANVKVHVSNIESLIERLGGIQLYGNDQSINVVLRELIQNARDAIVARRSIEDGFQGCIKIILEKEHNKYTIRVEVNRPRIAGGSNFQIGWSHDEQNDEQVFT